MFVKHLEMSFQISFKRVFHRQIQVNIYSFKIENYYSAPNANFARQN